MKNAARKADALIAIALLASRKEGISREEIMELVGEDDRRAWDVIARVRRVGRACGIEIQSVRDGRNTVGLRAEARRGAAPPVPLEGGWTARRSSAGPPGWNPTPIETRVANALLAVGAGSASKIAGTAGLSFDPTIRALESLRLSGVARCMAGVWSPSPVITPEVT